MWTTPPDPRNSAAFKTFVDSFPAHRMTSAEIDRETTHWINWQKSNGVFAASPRPGWLTSAGAKATGAAGGGFTLAGALGWISGTLGDLATTGGIVMLFGSLFFAARSETETQAMRDALVLLDIRLEALIYRQRQLGVLP